MTGLVLTFKHMVYYKHNVWTEKDKIIKYMALCGKLYRDCAAGLYNAANFFVA
jgi:hypothetical protein